MADKEPRRSKVTAAFFLAEYGLQTWLETTTPEQRLEIEKQKAASKQFQEEVQKNDRQREQEAAAENEVAQRFLAPYVSIIQDAVAEEPLLSMDVTYHREKGMPQYRVSFSVAATLSEEEFSLKDGKFYFHFNITVDAHAPFDETQRVQLPHPYDLGAPRDLTPEAVKEIFLNALGESLKASIEQQLIYEWIEPKAEK